MARLVAYEDSDSSGSDREDAQPTKKRKLGIKEEGKQALPPLPSSFQDLYSSTVRTSTQDDPSLHGGRKRVTPHVEGNWPTHVYLECKLRGFLCNRVISWRAVGRLSKVGTNAFEGIHNPKKLCHCLD